MPSQSLPWVVWRVGAVHKAGWSVSTVAMETTVLVAVGQTRNMSS